MSTILRLSTDEYDQMIAKGAFDRLDRRIELIRGELREMNPAGPIHDDYIAFLTRWSNRSLPESLGYLRVQSGLDLPELGSRPEPDVLWVLPKRYLDRHPRCHEVLLGIEVADSSIAFDRGEKAELYAEAGMREYWVVDVNGRCVHVYSDPAERAFAQQTTVGLGADLSPQVRPEARLDTGELFAG